MPDLRQLGLDSGYPLPRTPTGKDLNKMLDTISDCESKSTEDNIPLKLGRHHMEVPSILNKNARVFGKNRDIPQVVISKPGLAENFNQPPTRYNMKREGSVLTLPRLLPISHTSNTRYSSVPNSPKTQKDKMEKRFL